MSNEQVPDYEFCPFCFEWVTYTVKESVELTTFPDHNVSITRHRTYCDKCGEEFYGKWFKIDLEHAFQLREIQRSIADETSN